MIRLGGSAKAQGSAGVAGLAADAISAFNNNPAFLKSAGNSQQMSLSALFVDSNLTTSIGESSDADRGPGVIPELAFSKQAGDPRLTLGAGVVVQSALQADFEFVDPPSDTGISYGRQRHRSEFVVAKMMGGAAFQINQRLTIGASLGLAYNRNRLRAPYTFQSNPDLAGAKVLVDLDSDGFAAIMTVGADYSINDAFSVSLAFTPKVDFAARGELTGNLRETGLGFAENFEYDARVSTALPASLTGGATLQMSEKLRLGLQWDWIDWESAFDELPLSLSSGNNQQLNGLLGTDRIRDTAPLNWRSQHIVHVGGDYQINQRVQLRGGYEYSNIPVPSSTATPMTAAILERAFTTGLGIELDRGFLDFSYRFSTGDDFNVNRSQLLGGEYSGTQQSLSLHSFSVTYSIK